VSDAGLIVTMVSVFIGFVLFGASFKSFMARRRGGDVGAVHRRGRVHHTRAGGDCGVLGLVEYAGPVADATNPPAAPNRGTAETLDHRR
jgi:hypothetical protein